MSIWEVFIREIDTQKLLVYTIRYRSDVTRPEDFGEELDLSGSMSTTAESGGATYDVYLASSALNEITNYHLFFMPAEGYLASLAIKSGTVYPEEILDYFSRLSLKAV